MRLPDVSTATSRPHVDIAADDPALQEVEVEVTALPAPPAPPARSASGRAPCPPVSGGGALSEAVERPGDFTDDLNHLSIQGHACAAELAWTALQDAGLVPGAKRPNAQTCACR